MHPASDPANDLARWKSSLPSRVRGHAVRGLRWLCPESFIAVQQLQTYWAILEKVRGSSLRLTKLDDEIYEHLQKDFPEFDPAETIDENQMKSKEGKEKWRNFMMAYEKKVDDYNFGTILRTSPTVEYDQDTTIFGMLETYRPCE
jgi:hypothetical protein